jgi:hypothetical protein
VRSDQPLASVDAKLARWLRTPNTQTLVVSLGSHREYSDDNAAQMAIALRSLMQKRPELQVLWKIKKQRKATWFPGNLLAKEQAQGRAQVVDWIRPSMLTVLQEPTVMGLVNHGGAGMWFEGVT